MGVKLLDAGPNLLDLRFAEDVLLFAEARVETGGLLGALVKQLDRLGLPNSGHYGQSWSDCPSFAP